MIDPERLYLYWDVATEVRVASNPLVVRVHCVSEGRSCDFDPGAADNWYLRVTPNRTYRFELFENQRGVLKFLAASEEVTTPIRWSGESGKHPPAEVIQAERRPIARVPKRTTAKIPPHKPVAVAPLGPVAPPESPALPAVSPAPPGLPPTPVAPPRARLPAREYARGTRK